MEIKRVIVQARIDVAHVVVNLKGKTLLYTYKYEINYHSCLSALATKVRLNIFPEKKSVVTENTMFRC